MASKLYLNNQDYDAPYEVSESEDEYSEEEKQILKEVRKGNKKKVDSKKEILAFDESADEDDNEENDDILGDSDIERGDEYDGIPDAKAWGKQRRSYYNTDFVDQDYSAYNEQEEEQAQQEEEEAKSIQLRLAKQLDEADFFLDLPKAAEVDTDEEQSDAITAGSKSKESKKSIELKADLSGMSQRQKQQLFEKDSPEFAGLVADFETHLSESQTLLDPILNYCKETNLHLPIIDFVETRSNMIMTYCTNVAFYLLLKSKRIPIKNHPITKRLAQLRKFLIQLDEKYDSVVKPQLEEMLERINSGEELNIQPQPKEKKPSKKLRMMNVYNEERPPQSDESDGYEDVPPGKRTKLSEEESASASEESDAEMAEGDDEDERRGITYQIAKNKGLTPHRKKELRNPRVRHRSKFRKALIRRKGAVRTVRKEIQRYGGEVSGIKATVKKGIKLKS